MDLTRAALFLLAAAAGLAGACFQSMPGPGGGDGDGDSSGDGAGGSFADAIVYRDDLDAHPGCSTAGLDYPAASIPGYRCAAKLYPLPSGTAEDTSKPIVLLIHGNSDAPESWERWPVEGGAPQLAERLVAEGRRVYAIDLRIDLVDDPQGNNDTENAARNIDHGWAVPLVMHFITSVLDAHPGRQIAIVGFSLGVTVTRDALRRLHRADAGAWARLDALVYLAGANHGVSTFAKLCGKNPTMRGRVACEMGARDAFAPTDFMRALNGKSGAYETPCADGDVAFGEAGACGGHTVKYTTIVMRDIDNGSYQDEFVSEASSALAGADNRLIALTDTDESGYFFNGLLKNHYGAARSDAALALILEAL